jgi:hypothetical protein
VANDGESHGRDLFEAIERGMSAFNALHPGNHMSLKTKEEQMQQSSNGRVQILEGNVGS